MSCNSEIELYNSQCILQVLAGNNTKCHQSHSPQLRCPSIEEPLKILQFPRRKVTHVLHIEDKSAQHVPLSDGFSKAHGTSSTQEGGKGLDGMMGGDVGPPVNRSTHQPINHSPDLAWFQVRCCFKLLLLEPTAPVLLVCLCSCGYLFVHSFLAMYLNADSSLVQSCWLVCSMFALLHVRPVLPAESLCRISFCPIHLKRFFERLG